MPIAAIVITACNTKLQKQVPVIKVSNDSINIGIVPKNTTTAVQVVIHSAGKDTLCIKSIGVDCGCTKAAMTINNIAPGDSALMNLSYDAKTGGDSGSFYKAIVVRSNAINEEYKVIKLYGRVE
jgi:hypothetical protein